MNRITTIILHMFFVSFGMQAQYLFDSLSCGGYQRSYVLHLPKNYSGNNRLPLVMAFHGGGGVGWQSIAGQSMLTNKSDSSGFILVYPEGVPINGYRGWNAGGCCPFSTTYDVDDVGFINAMLDTLIQKYTIDTTRMYATGSSNGGIFCFRLAIDLSHRIAAIAPNAATSMYTTGKPKRAVPIINFHSFQDLNVPYDGGIGIGDFRGYFPSQDSTLSFWKKSNHCQSVDTIHKGTDFIQIRYSRSDGGADIIHYATYDGGHSWPGGPQIQGKDPSSKFISATYLLWEFFKMYKLDQTSTGIESNDGFDSHVDANPDLFQNYPNPFNPSSIIRYHFPQAGHVTLKVFDVLGREVATLVDETQEAGFHQSLFSTQEHSLASGVYFYRLSAGSYAETKRMLVMK